MSYHRVMHRHPLASPSGVSMRMLVLFRESLQWAWPIAMILFILFPVSSRAQSPLNAVAHPGTIICIGDSTEILLIASGGYPPYQFSRDGVHFQSSPALQGFPAGVYTNLTVMDSLGSVYQLPHIQLPDGLVSPINYFMDNDGDGYGTGNAIAMCTDPGSGFSVLGGDCNDNSDLLSPGSQEVCNSIDDDCDGSTDDSLVFDLYYADADGDQFGAGPAAGFCEDPGNAYVTNDGDCDDSNPLINPAVHEEFNGIDDNCNGLIDYNDVYPPDTCDLVISAQGSIPCNGGTADIVLTITGGTTPYALGPGVTSGLSPGVYSYNVSDATGCTAGVTHVLTDPAPLQVQVSSPGIICSGDLADVTVSATGGTGAYSGTGLYQRGPGFWNFMVSDSAGCTAQAQIDLQEPAPLNMQVTAGTIQCHGGTAQVVVSANGGVLPYSGAGTFIQPAGTQTYALIDANGCTRDTIITLIQPDTLPLPTAWTGQFTACVPATNGAAVFTVDPVSDGLNPTFYSWIPPTGMTVAAGQGTSQVTLSWTGLNVDKSILAPLTLSVTNGCVIRTVSRTVSYSAAAPVTPPSISGPSKLCPGDTGIYSFLVVPRATRYVWTVPQGMKFVGDSTSNVAVIAVQQNYTGGTINVTAWNACGGSPARSRSVVLNTPIVPGAISGPTSGLCGMSGVSYSISPVSGAGSYHWSVPAGAVILSGQGTTQITVNFNGASSGTVKVKSLNTCGASAERSLTVSLVPARPDPISANPGGTPCAGTVVGYSVPTTTGAQSYLWNITTGGIIQSGQGTKSIAIAWSTSAANTTQSVTVRASNTCGNSTTRAVSMAVGSCLKTEAAYDEETTRSKVYPNPAHGSAFVSYAINNPGVVEFKLISITGHVLHVERVQHDTAGSFVREFPIQELGVSSGVYVIAVSREGITENIRLVVR